MQIFSVYKTFIMRNMFMCRVEFVHRDTGTHYNNDTPVFHVTGVSLIKANKVGSFI